MPEAIQTFAHNHPNTWADGRLIEDISPEEIRRIFKLRKGELDVLVGGPPCQGFSINAPGRFLNDPRNKLFKDYLRFLSEFQPSTFVFENVPGLLSLAEGRIFNEIVQELSSHGYEVSFRILFAAHYGVPQERWRLIILGSRAGLVMPPNPTHYAKGRANFRGGRTLTFQIDETEGKWLHPFVSVGEAVGDLPRLSMGEGGEHVEYVQSAHSEFARTMRNPDGFTFNHYASKLSKQNVQRMQHVKPGGSWRDIPHELLPAGMQKARKSDHTKRYGRLTNAGLAGTVMTKCDPHWSAVFLPDQDRALTVREAARLQSFPDSYDFKGSRVSQYVQVGNAVPVLMARAIATSVSEHLQSLLDQDTVKVAMNG
jgi:DNA (cytosine-5)-methyltransferase 1